MARPTRTCACSLALAALGAGAPVAGHSTASTLQQRLAEVAALYGNGSGAARIAEAVPSRSAARLLGAPLRSDRFVVVFALRGRARLTGYLPTLGGLAPRGRVVAGALDQATGAVLAVRLLSRQPRLGGLGQVRLARVAPASRAPRVVGTAFDTAFERLLSAGWRVAVPAFPALGGTVLVTPNGLGRYVVADALPVGPKAVRLRLGIRSLPIGSPAFPIDGPATVTVPSFIGMPYAAAMAGVPGLHILLGHVGPLRPASSRRGLDAFVVTAQAPSAGTIVPAYGAFTSGGVDLEQSTVTLTLGVRGPGAG